MQPLLTALLVIFSLHLCQGQKMLILERANRVKTTKYYIGETLTFRLKGDEDYWYKRQITDIMTDQKSLMLDNYVVKLEDIDKLRIPKPSIVRYLGGTVFSFGASLVFASTVAAIYGSDERYGLLYGGAVTSMGLGYFMGSRKKIKIGKKFRLRATEIRFN